MHPMARKTCQRQLEKGRKFRPFLLTKGGISVVIIMHTVIETAPYLASAKDEKVSNDERQAIVDYISANPDAGVIMAGTGGARKLRFAGRGKGKSGGFRIIIFYAAEDIPVFLLDI